MQTTWLLLEHCLCVVPMDDAGESLATHEQTRLPGPALQHLPR